MEAVSLVPAVQKRAAVFLPITGDVTADLKTRSALVTAARVAGLDVTLLVETKGNPRIARSQVVLAATNGKVDVVVVSALGDLGANVLDAISAALDLLAIGAKILSLSVHESWLGTSDPTPALTWFLTAEKARRAQVIREGMERARARAPGMPVGRPRKPVDVQAALALIGQGTPIEKAARAQGVSRSQLKRALTSHEALPVAAADSPLPQRVADFAHGQVAAGGAQ